jgi:hypothetical protein
MGQHRLVGLEDQRVLGAIALAILRLGDLPEVVALLDRIEDGRLGGCGAGGVGADLQLVGLHLRHTQRVANRDHRLFEDRLVLDLALQYGGVALDLDLDAVGAELV